MVDGFESRRHYAGVCRDHQNNNVGRFRSTGTHSSESFVAWSVKENNFPPISRRFLIDDTNFVGAYMLRDAAGFSPAHIRDSNRIEQRGLAVIDVSHDRKHGWKDAGLGNQR